MFQNLLELRLPLSKYNVLKIKVIFWYFKREYVDCQLKFEKHINGKIVTANKLVGIIRRSFMFLNEEIFVPLYKSLVRSHFDYGMSVWTPH